MHDYSLNSSERRNVPFYLAVFSILLAWAIGPLPIPWWFDTPAVLGFYGILYFAFDKWIWKAKFLRKLGIIKTPLIEGTWEGELNSSHGDGKNKIIKVIILQTWTQMKIYLESDTSKSYSFEGSIVIDGFEIPMLYYQFQSCPKNGTVETMHIHFGSVHAKILSDDLIEAEYYSGRDRQNTGIFRIEKKK